MAGLVYGYNAVRSYLRSDEFRVMLGYLCDSLVEYDRGAGLPSFIEALE